MDDEFESLMTQVGKLMSARRFDEALDILERARDSAITLRDNETAAVYSDTRAAVLTVCGRNDEATREYEMAEQLDRTNAYGVLATANHLLSNVGDAPAAMRKVREVMDNITNNSLAHFAASLLGLGHAAQNDNASALHQLASMARSLDSLPSSAIDLRLVEALVEKGVRDAAMIEYVDRVRMKARNEPDHAVLARVERLWLKIRDDA